MFHLLNYFVAAGVNAANTDMAASIDANFSQRNSHYIMSERYNMLAWAHLAVSATRARFNVPRWNNYGRMTTGVVNRLATPPSYPRINDYRAYPIPLPVNEEIAVEASNNLAMATEDTTSLIWIATPDWTQNLTRGEQRLTIRATGAVATTADSWSGLGAITFADNLLGGWYAINHVSVQSSNARAFRLMFPRMPAYQLRHLRPGNLVNNAIGNIEDPVSPAFFGEWGKFHTFEPPQLEVYGDAAGADTQEIRIDLTYLGTRAPAGYAPTGAEAS